jgi:hypothetical protein
MPTVRIGRPMTHLILSAAGPPPQEKKPPIRSLEGVNLLRGVDSDGLNLDHVSWGVEAISGKLSVGALAHSVKTETILGIYARVEGTSLRNSETRFTRRLCFRLVAMFSARVSAGMTAA